MPEIHRDSVDRIVADALVEYPMEACGLLLGIDGVIVEVYPARNESKSAQTYTIRPLDVLKADRRAESQGWDIVGCYHSHTHSEPFPSPTDVANAPDPSWWYLILSLRQNEPELRGFKIVDGNISEVPLVEAKI